MNIVRLLLVGTLLSTTACAGRSPEPRHVRAADFGKVLAAGGEPPFVIEFDEGDVIPLRFTLDGPFVQSAKDASPILLRVRRHFFLRVDKSGLRASADGKDFDAKSAKPGQFRFGFGKEKGGELFAEMAITAPVPADLPPAK